MRYKIMRSEGTLKRRIENYRLKIFWGYLELLVIGSFFLHATVNSNLKFRSKLLIYTFMEASACQAEVLVYRIMQYKTLQLHFGLSPNGTSHQCKNRGYSPQLGLGVQPQSQSSYDIWRPCFLRDEKKVLIKVCTRQIIHQIVDSDIQTGF